MKHLYGLVSQENIPVAARLFLVLLTPAPPVDVRRAVVFVKMLYGLGARRFDDDGGLGSRERFKL